jgi:hypothetical protein
VTTSTQSNPLPKKVMTETTKKAEVLRIEALLDKNLPSIEANTHVIQNFINSGRIRQIIDFALNPNVSSIVESYDKTLVMTKTNNSVVSSSVVSSSVLSSSLMDDFSQTMSLTENINETETSIVRFANSYTGLNTNHINSNINESDFQINTNVRIDDKSYVKHKLNSSLNQNEHKYEKQLLVRTKPIKPMCSSVPPNLCKKFILFFFCLFHFLNFITRLKTLCKPYYRLTSLQILYVSFALDLRLSFSELSFCMSFTPSLTLSTTLFRSFIYLFKKFRFF